MNNIFLLVFFLVGAYFDIRYRGLPKWLLAGGFLLSLFWYWIEKPVSWQEMIIGMAVGGVLLIISWITKGALGLGDGVFLMVVGIQLGIGVIIILGWGFLLAAIVSLIFLMIRKVSGKTSIPFIPFLTAAYFIFILKQGSYI